MIGFLEGQVLARLKDGLVLLTPGGIGYQLHLPLPLLSEAGEPGDQRAYYVVTVVRETEISLYGFSDLAGKILFELLITVSGVGPKAALAFLSAFAPNDLVGAIAHHDVALLTTIPGIGKKIATRLCLELSDRLAKEALQPQGSAGPRGELLSALTNLGFQEKDVLTALQQMPPQPGSFSDQLRQALNLLGKN